MSKATVDTFSYATPDDPWLKRVVIRAVELMTGQPTLKRMYLENQERPVPGESFWAAAIRHLALRVHTNQADLEALPRTGALMVIANHPFGVLDGIVISHLISQVRPDFRILTNAVLYRAEEIRPYLLPIDFSPTKGPAIDAEWGTFAAGMIHQAKAPVVPVFFAGQNSRLFQLVSHMSMTLRLSLVFKEVHDRIGTDIPVRVGNTIAYEQLSPLKDRKALMQVLRERTLDLGTNMPALPTKRSRKLERFQRVPT
jgi:putative hemolysin